MLTKHYRVKRKKEDLMSTKIMNQSSNASFMKKHGSAITIGLWIIALSSHAILIPKLLHDFTYRRH